MCWGKFKGVLQPQREVQIYTSGPSCCSALTPSGTEQFYPWPRIGVNFSRPHLALFV